MKEGFYEGDRVIAVVNSPGGLPIYAGEYATVLADTKPNYLVPVRFDSRHPDRHDCNGLCERGHGFYMFPVQLKYPEEEPLEPWSEEDWGVIFEELRLMEVNVS